MKKSSKIAIIISSVLLIAIAVTFIVVLTTSISDKKYKINFYNDEAKAELIYSVEVKKDEEVAYDYNKYGNPEKAATQTNTYTFIGWADSEKTYRLNENLPKATKNTDYVAKFEENIRKYTIKFITDEGEELYQYSGNAGSMAEYGGIIPTKDSSIVYDYTFSGWNPELSVITEDKTYIAKFSETLRKYEVKFVDEDGLTVLSTKEYEYGSTPVFDGSYPEKADYEFVGWNMGDANYGIDDQLDIVDSDQTYIARYIMVVNVNYDSISVEMKESTRPNALVEFDMTVLPEDEVGELVFTFGNRVLPIYVNGVLQEHYTPLNGKYEAYISEDLKVYLTEPETVYQLILVINNVKSDPINLTLADGIWLTDELEIAKDTKLIFLDYTRGIVLDTKAKLDKDNKVNNDMIITESSKYIISIDQDNNEVLALSTIIPVVTDYYLLGSFNYYTESDSYKLTKEDELYTISLKLLKNDKLYIKLGSIIYNYESLAANELFAKDDNNYINTLFGGNYKLSFNPETSKITIALVDEFSVTIGENVYNLTLDKSDYSYEALYKVNLSCEKDSIISFNRGIFLEEDRETYLNNIKFVDSKYIVLKTIEDKTLYLKVTYQNTEFKYLVWLDGCPKDYSITYDLAGGTLAEGKSNPESYTIETESFTLNNPVKENYEFIGWTSDSISAPTLEVTVAKGSTGALSFTANYTPVEFTITYDLAGGALAEGKSNPEKYTVETESFTLNNPAKEGYNFVGWTSDDITTPTLEVIITLGSSGNLAFVANYEAIEYSITYDLAGGALAEGKSNPDKYTIETENFTLNNPLKENYEFIGWTYEGVTNPALEVVIEKGSIGELSFTANYTPVEFTITYDLAGGALAEGKSNPEKYTVETESFTLNNPSKSGYNFIGWTSTDITTPALEVVITLGSSGNLAFVANYEVIEYNISYNLSGGSLEVGITNPDKYTVETENFTLNNPSKVNYDFIGWTSADITTPTIEVTIVKGSTGDLSFTANYTPTVFNITYNLKGGELEVGKSNPESYTVESVDFTLNNPIKTGCSFIGWTYNDITTPVVTVTIDCSETTGDIEFVANYEAITYTIEFNKNSESATGTMASMTLKYDEQKALSANNFAYTDMRFIGWATSNNGDVVYNPGQNVINLTATNNAVITLYAVWRNDIRKSSVLSSIKLKEGTDEIDNSTYTYDGYEKTPTVEIGIPETEYTVEYIDNISAGSATVRITGINTYDGVIDRTFKINEYEIALTWDEDEFVYNATTQTVIAKFTDVFGETRELVATAEQYNTSTSTYSPATFRDAGSYLLTATLEGDDAVNYKFRDTTSSDNYVRVNDYTAQKTYDLAKAKLTVNYGDIEFVYDGTQKSISNDNPTIISGLYGNDVVTITSISYADSERIDASSYKFECVLVGEAAGNYEAEDYLVITKKPVAIEWNTDSTEYDFVYSGSNKTVTARYQTVDNTYEYLTVTIRKDNYNVYFREAGTYNLSVNPFQGNYQFNDADKNRTYTISKKHLSIVWDNIDSENTVEMTYTSTSIDIGYSINGYVDGLIQSTVNYSPETPVNVGEYTCSLSIDISMTNYEIDDEITNVTLKVVPKSIKAVWSNTTKTYDSTALLPSVDLIFDGATDNPYPSDSSNLSVLATIEGGHTNAGLYTATAELSGLAKDNYVITTNETTQFNINKKVLTVRPNNVNLYLNASISAISNTFTYSCEGLVGGDTTNSVFSGEPSYIVKKSNGDLAPDTSSVVITYYIHILVNLVSPNYDVSPQPGELNFITKSLSNSEITLESNSYIFNNTEQKPNVTSVKIAQDTLDLNDDYVIVYPDNNLGDYINTGTYTIRVDGRGEYFGNYKDFEFTISSAELDDNLVSQSGSLTYTGSEQAATVTTVATHLDQTISYTYSANETGEYTSDVPGFTYADSYTVYYKATASNHSEATGQFVVTIAKADLYDMDLVFRYQTITTGPYVYGDSFMVNRLQSKVYTAQSVELANSNAGSYTLLDGPLTVGTHTYNVKYTPANENYNFFVKEETITMTYIVKYVLSGTQDSTSWSVVGERKTIMENMQDATYVIDYSDSSSYTPNKTYIDALFMMPLTITGYRIVPDVGNEYVVAAGSSITLNCNVTIYPYFDEIPTP